MESSKMISELFLENSFFECVKWSHYLGIYDKYFSSYRGKSPVILEIGVRRGGSLGIWRKYFGDGATIIGIDIDSSCEELEKYGFKIYIGDQSDELFLSKILEGQGLIDIVVDDGSHVAADMIKTFEYLYPRIKDNALYIVEDVVPSILQSQSSGDHISFVEYSYNLLFQLNLGFTNQSLIEDSDDKARMIAIKSGKVVGGMSSSLLSDLVVPTEFTATTNSINFHPNMVVFEKSPQSIRGSVKTEMMRPGELKIYSSYGIKKKN